MKVLIVIDNQGWCWSNSAYCVARCLPDIDIQLIEHKDFKFRLEKDGIRWLDDFSTILVRGYSDLFLTHDQAAAMRGRFIATLCTGGHRLVPHIRDMEDTARHASYIMVQNRRAHTELVLAGYRSDRILVIPNGVDTTLFHPSEGNKARNRQLGMAANIRNERSFLKGTDICQEACDIAGWKFTTATATDRRMPHELLAQWYRNLEAYAQPSIAEGCSNSIMEAMASGLPCLIVKDVGYHGEVCQDGIGYEDGQVVFVQRHPMEVASTLKILEQNPHIYQRICRNAREFAEAHDWSHIAPLFRTMFQMAEQQGTCK